MVYVKCPLFRAKPTGELLNNGGGGRAWRGLARWEHFHTGKRMTRFERKSGGKEGRN